MSDDIDAMLRREGERWRAGQPSAPLIGAVPARRRDPLPRVALLAVAAVLVLAAVPAVIFISASRLATARTGTSWTPDTLAAAVPSPGDAVTGEAAIVAEPGKPVLLCAPFTWEQSDQPLVCQPGGVELRGVDLAALPDRYEASGIVFSPHAVVHGRWTGDAIDVTSVVAPSHAAQAPVPCPPPVGGWPSATATGLDVEAAVRRLNETIAAHPDRYLALQGMAGPGVDVAVVTIRGDLAAARRELEAVYPLGLCLVPAVAVTDERLETVAAALKRPGWDTIVDRTGGRVLVRLPVLDQDAVALLEAFPEAVPLPLVIKD